jgi:hypothetical protein
MLTRKRQKLLEIQEKLNLETFQSFQFDPILESIAQFFNLTDCARVANLNHSYHSKTWFYVLHSSSRSKKLNSIIPLDSNSVTWMTKYRMHLQYQKIEAVTFPFDLSTIPKCHSLSVYRSTTFNFPSQAKHLICTSCYEKFPHIANLQSVSIRHYCYACELTVFPATITKLKLHSFFLLNGHKLPFLPNLETFQCNIPHFENMEIMEQKFPNLTTLHLVYDYTIIDLEQFAYFRYRLIIESKSLMITNKFTTFKCQELDLSQCPNILDYSGVAHISIVKRCKQK